MKITLEDIRFNAEEASIEPSKWYDLMSMVEDFIKEINYCGSVERLITTTDTINHDMMMSFLFSISDTPSELTLNVRKNLNVIDKKWTGVEDETIAGGLVEMARYDLINRLDAFSMDQLIKLSLGLAGYFTHNDIYVEPSEIRDYTIELKEFLNRGTITSSDEHNSCVISTDGAFGIINKNSNIVNIVVATIVNYMKRQYPLIVSSDFDIYNEHHRYNGMMKFKTELTFELYQVLRQGHDVKCRSIDPSIIDKPVIYMNAMLPILDLGLRIVLYGHILNCDRNNGMNTSMLVWDTLEIRRVLENEYAIISNGRRNEGRENSIESLRNYKKEFQYIGSGLW